MGGMIGGDCHRGRAILCHGCHALERWVGCSEWWPLHQQCCGSLSKSETSMRSACCHCCLVQRCSCGECCKPGCRTLDSGSARCPVLSPSWVLPTYCQCLLWRCSPSHNKNPTHGNSSDQDQPHTFCGWSWLTNDKCWQQMDKCWQKTHNCWQQTIECWQ